MRSAKALVRSVLIAVALGGTVCAHAHDPSAWGGMFRSRDFGGSWLSTDAGLFIGAALAVAVSPTDANHLLYATDTRLLRSRNGGRDWVGEAEALVFGPTPAVVFAHDGRGAVASSSAGVFFTRGDGVWVAAAAPSGAAPARVIARGAAPGEFLLGGPRGIYSSRDGGQSWQRIEMGDTEEPATAIAAPPASRRAFAIVGAQLRASQDGGATWHRAMSGLPNAVVEAVFATMDGKQVWAAAEGRLYRSDAGTIAWQPAGQPLPLPRPAVRAFAVSPDGRTIVAATHRGMLRSTDGGGQWQAIEGTLPVHLDAGLVTPDPHDAQTLYGGFSLSPYPEVWRRAEEGNNLLSRIDPLNLAGGAAFLVLLLGGGILGARALARASASR